MKNFVESPQRGGAGPVHTGRAVRGLPVRRAGFVWRVRALVRLARRVLRARREYAQLRHLDAETLRDLGLGPGEIGSVAAELRGRVAPSRRRTDFESGLTASRFRVREIDSAL